MTKEINYQAEVAESVTKEFNEFYGHEMKKSKDEIFYDYYQIHFYNELKDFLVSEEGDYYLDEEEFKCLHNKGIDIIASLYSYYLKEEYASINNWEDISDFIKDYNKHYHDSSMGGTEIE